MVKKKVLTKKTPKRPTNGFGNYIKLNKNQNNKSFSDLAKEWREGCCPKVKNQCLKKAQRDMLVYKARKSRLLKRRPKKALSGYTLFVKDYLDKEKNKEEKGMKAVFSEAAAKWRSLNEQEKDSWKQNAVSSNNSNNKKTSYRKKTSSKSRSIKSSRSRSTCGKRRR